MVFVLDVGSKDESLGIIELKKFWILYLKRKRKKETSGLQGQTEWGVLASTRVLELYKLFPFCFPLFHFNCDLISSEF